MMDLRIMPVMEIIRHKTFTVVRKTAKSAKVSWYTVHINSSIESTYIIVIFKVRHRYINTVITHSIKDNKSIIYHKVEILQNLNVKYGEAITLFKSPLF